MLYILHTQYTMRKIRYVQIYMIYALFRIYILQLSIDIPKSPGKAAVVVMLRPQKDGALAQPVVLGAPWNDDDQW